MRSSRSSSGISDSSATGLLPSSSQRAGSRSWNRLTALASQLHHMFRASAQSRRWSGPSDWSRSRACATMGPISSAASSSEAISSSEKLRSSTVCTISTPCSSSRSIRGTPRNE